MAHAKAGNFQEEPQISLRLLSAIRQGDNESVFRALSDGADVNTIDNEGKSALLYAVEKDNKVITKELIKNKANVNHPDKNDMTPLCHALNYGNTSMAKLLIEANVDVQKADNKGKTALFYAVEKSDKAMMVQGLISKGANVNRKDKKGKTALFYAVQSSRQNILEVLIKNGANVNINDNEGKTALFYAVQRSNNESVVCALINAGADVNLTDKEGKTALSYAPLSKIDGSALLFDAVKNGKSDLVRGLVKSGVRVDITNSKGETALHNAVKNDKEKLVRTLIECGANVNMTDNDLKPALLYAFEGGNENIVKILMDGGADVNITDSHGRSMLFYSITFSLPMTRDLLSRMRCGLNEECHVDILKVLIDKSFFKARESQGYVNERLQFLKDQGVSRSTIKKSILQVVFSKLPLYLAYILNNNDCFEAVMELARKYTKHLYGKSYRRIGKILKKLKKMKKRMDEKYVTAGILKILAKLKTLAISPDNGDSDGNTALHYATELALHGVSQESIMKLCQQLKKLGQSPDVKNYNEETPLLFCLSRTTDKISKEKHSWPGIRILKAVFKFLLVDLGAAVEERTKNEVSVMHLTLKLLQKGLPKDDTGLRNDAIVEGLELLNIFLGEYRQRGLSVNSKDKDHNTPLHIWASLKLKSYRQYAIDVGPQVPKFGELLKTILDKLLQSPAEVKIENKNGETPFHLCRTWAAVELLLKAGADPNVLDASGCSPLLSAARHKTFLECSSRFYPDFSGIPIKFWRTAIDKKLDMYANDRKGISVLSILIESGAFELSEALIDVAGSERHLQQSVNIATSLLNAVCKDQSLCTNRKSNLVDKILLSNPSAVLCERGADSALHYCCRNIVAEYNISGDVDNVDWAIAKRLLLYRADCKVSDSRGQSCLDIAKECPALEDLLLQPINVEEAPVLIPWNSVSKKHKKKLEKVARNLESIRMDPYWYHQDNLACGAFGSVFSGINMKDGREVAIKRIEKTRMQKPQDKREIQNLTALADCEQVVRYLYFFEDETFSYVFLELMEGNLDEYLDSPDFRIVKESLKLCQDVVQGLNFLHAHEIIHRDLKPGNILYKWHPKLCLKIADFGLSRRIDGNSSTVYSISAGTRCWIAPEVLNMPEKAHSKLSDVFACGLVLHYILSVKNHPFAPRTGAPQHKIEANISNGKMVGWDASLCPEAAHLLRDMLVGDESKRPSVGIALDHPMFWSKTKKKEFLVAVANQLQFLQDSKKSAIKKDLKKSFGKICWDSSKYLHMPAIFKEMKKKRNYKTNSVSELLRLIRNAYAHVTELPENIQRQLLEDFVFFEDFPDLVMEVYKAVTTHGWDQTKEEIKHALR